MERFHNILFLYDPESTTDAAFKRAVKLAQTNNASLTVASVYPLIPRSFERMQDAFFKLQEQQLNNFITRFDTADIDIKPVIWLGTPFIQIIKAVIALKFDLVIKSAEGSGTIGDWLFGSTDLHLLRKCPCPVWIIKPSQTTKFKGIMAAVDIDPEEPENAELNQLILDLASAIARRENSELHIVHAWELAYEDTLRKNLGELPEVDVDNMINLAKSEHKEHFDSLLHDRNFDDISTHVHLIKGDPGKVIPKLAVDKHIELVVMGTVARTGIKGFFIGNTAERTLAAIDCSIMAVKPKSFTTPV